MDEKVKAHSVEIKALHEVSEKLRDSLQSIPVSIFSTKEKKNVYIYKINI